MEYCLKSARKVLVCSCVLSSVLFSSALAAGGSNLSPEMAEIDAQHKKLVQEAEQREREIQKKIRDTNEKLKAECKEYAQAGALTPLRSRRIDDRQAYCTKSGRVVPTKLNDYYLFVMGGKSKGKMVINNEEGIVPKEKIRALLGPKCASSCKQGVVAVLRDAELTAAQRTFSCNQSLKKNGNHLFAFCRENESKVHAYEGITKLILDPALTDADVQALLKSEQARLHERIQGDRDFSKEEGQTLGKEYGEMVRTYSARLGRDYDAYLDRIAEANAALYAEHQSQQRVENKVLDDKDWFASSRDDERENFGAARERLNRMQIYRGILCSNGRMTDKGYCVNGIGDAPPRYRGTDI